MDYAGFRRRKPATTVQRLQNYIPKIQDEKSSIAVVELPKI